MCLAAATTAGGMISGVALHSFRSVHAACKPAHPPGCLLCRGISIRSVHVGSPTGLNQRTRPHSHVRPNRWKGVWIPVGAEPLDTGYSGSPWSSGIVGWRLTCYAVALGSGWMHPISTSPPPTRYARKWRNEASCVITWTSSRRLVVWPPLQELLSSASLHRAWEHCCRLRLP